MNQIPFPVTRSGYASPYIQINQRTNGQIQGFRKIRQMEYPNYSACIIQQLFKDDQGKAQQKQPLVKIGLFALSGIAEKKPGQEEPLKNTQENNQIKNTDVNICSHGVKIGKIVF
jgi:hypothetical protein